MYNVYVLKSLKSGKRYVGVSSQDLAAKLKEHNDGGSDWTRNHKPFALAYHEKFRNKSSALKREKFFKSGDGRRVLDRIISK